MAALSAVAAPYFGGLAVPAFMALASLNAPAAPVSVAASAPS
jgi:hypothetical protein